MIPNPARRVFAEGFAPLMSWEHLMSLHDALADGCDWLLQNATTQPPCTQETMDALCRSACAIAFGGLGSSVGYAESEYSRLCYECDCRLGEPAACRYFLDWYDGASREVMRGELLTLVNKELRHRQRNPSYLGEGI